MKKLVLNADSLNDKMIINFFRIICVVELILIGYYNLFKLAYYCAYDSSSYFLKAYEMYRQGTLFISDWADQTSLYFDSPVPLAALLMYIFKDIFIAYGVANCIITVANLCLFNKILKELNFNQMSRLVATAFFLCPYLTTPFNISNDLGYYSCLFVSAGFYSVKILISFMYLLSMEQLLHCGKKNVWMVLSAICFFVSGMSSGYHLAIYAIVPGCAYTVWYSYTKREKKRCISSFIYNIACVIFLLIGKIVQTNVIGYESRDNEIAWCGLEDLWDNFISLIMGNLLSISALPRESNVAVLSAEGIGVVFGLLMMLVFCGGIAIAFKHRVYRKTEYMFFVIWGGGNAILLLLINSKYGDPIFEIRYMLPGVIAEMVMIAGIMCLKANMGYNILVGIVISCNILCSAINYSGSENNYDELKKVTAEIEKLDAPVVYMYGDGIPVSEKRAARVLDTDKTYLVMTGINSASEWGDSIKYCDNSEWDGATVLLTTPTDYYSLPYYMQLNYNEVWSDGTFSIYYSDKNKMDLESGVGQAEYAIDFPYSQDVVTGSGEFDNEGRFISDGSRGWVLVGPKLETDESGYYDFVLNYSMDTVEETQPYATFSVVYSVVGQNEDVVQTVELKADENRAVLELFYMDKAENGNYDCRVYGTDGVVLTVDSIEYIKRSK